ncbi:PAS domain-containing protein, partial [Streptomyces sp. NPDC127044]
MATSGKKPGGDAPVTLHARVLLDARGVITEWNAEAERLLGHRPEEMVGQPLSSRGAAGRAPGAGGRQPP